MQSKRKCLFIIVIVTACIHIAGYYFYDSLKNPKEKQTYEAPPKSRPPYLQKKQNSNSKPGKPLNLPGSEKPNKIYSWIDENGVRNFSNLSPAKQIAGLHVKDEIFSEPTGSKLRKTPVYIRRNQVMVPVRLGIKGFETQTMLVLDTGATTTCVHREIATRLNLKEKQKGTARVADGRMIRTETAKLDYIIVGPYKLDDFEIQIIDYRGGKDDSSGLLGMNFLKHSPYKIDFENETILWLN